MTVMIMNQIDINSVVNLLSDAIRNRDWDAANEALEYMIEFQDEPIQFEEE